MSTCRHRDRRESLRPPSGTIDPLPSTPAPAVHRSNLSLLPISCRALSLASHLIFSSHLTSPTSPTSFRVRRRPLKTQHPPSISRPNPCVNSPTARPRRRLPRQKSSKDHHAHRLQAVTRPQPASQQASTRSDSVPSYRFDSSSKALSPTTWTARPSSTS